MSQLQLMYHTPKQAQYLENIALRLPGFSQLINIPYANVVTNPQNNKSYIHINVPGMYEVLSIATTFGKTQFTESDIRTLLSGGTVVVQVSNGQSNVVFEPYARYEGSNTDYLGQIIFSKNHAQ